MEMDCLMTESIYGFDPLLVDSSSDLDGDGLNALEEFQGDSSKPCGYGWG